MHHKRDMGIRSALIVGALAVVVSAAAQTDSHSLHDMAKLNRLSKISARFRDAQKNGEFAKAKSIIETELIPEQGERANYDRLARLEFEMGDIDGAEKNFDEFRRLHPVPLEETGWSLSMKIFGKMIAAAKSKSLPIWTDLRPTGNGYTPLTIIDSECQMAIASGYVRTANAYLVELPKAGEPDYSIAILRKRVEELVRKQAEYQAAKHAEP